MLSLRWPDGRELPAGHRNGQPRHGHSLLEFALAIRAPGDTGHLPLQAKLQDRRRTRPPGRGTSASGWAGSRCPEN